MTKRATLRGRRVISNDRYAHENDVYQRIWRINEAIRHDDIGALRNIGRGGGGFVNNSLRRRVWPVLLQYDTVKLGTSTIDNDKEEHSDEKQVLLDVDRSLNAYPEGLDEASKKEKQTELNEVIVEVLRRNKALHYYQPPFLLQHSLTYYYTDAMLDTLDPVLRQVTLLDTLYQHEDHQISDFLQEYVLWLFILLYLMYQWRKTKRAILLISILLPHRANVLPYYCLSWVITWCSHDIDDFSIIPRLFDLFLSSNPLMPVYFAAAIVLAHKEELLQQECENSAVHTFLSKLPQKPLDVEAVVNKATELELAYPPKDLQQQAQIGLDETSSVNTWEDEKLSDEAREKAREILKMEPSERKPRAIVKTNPQQERKIRRMMAAVGALSIGIAAAAMVSARYL
ncbi:hypothetical protein INT43_002865 [Umbelopsis isabellina]|uniref:Rab-GAP TBC domain-containing protein n=1 Tax=Mortierella isabellina TaxID=91625 RepID=A0A8H7ULR6_MORIS|nr:hypothetical protein INT43_002865 [Umbelopsis isabellina]